MVKLKTLLIITLSTILLFTQIGYAQNIKASISVNGKSLKTGSVQVINKKVYVSYKDVFQALGYTVESDSKYNLLRAKKDKNIIVVQSGVNTAKVNGELKTMNDMPLTTNGSIYVPLDFIKSSTGADTKFNYDIQKADITSATPPNADNTAEDKIIADRLAAETGKTSNELLKLKSDLGNWPSVIVKVFSDEKENDTVMVAKIKSIFGYTDETLLKMKYKLGNWIDVFGYLITEREQFDDSYFAVSVSPDMPLDLQKKIFDRAIINRQYNILHALCNSLNNVESKDREKWQAALQNEKLIIDFLEAAKLLGMPDNVIKDFKDNQKLYDYEIYMKARGIWRYGGNYKNDSTGATTIITAHPRMTIDINNVTTIDPFDNVVKSELKLSDRDVKRYTQCGINDMFSIAKLSSWKVTYANDIKNFKSLSEKYKVTIDKINELRLNYISWQQIENILKETNGKDKI